ncbi:Tho complex subunit 7-domain-containing protein [Xylaria bambusicola]|uniref:Tho complex subunit 7-domain-containing protein n=1 Tax=Xylaria bambusicola TaxID=326684 RepID=UPI002008A36B|nr:Tho complex subunit 7-domain-containing protein [Xylaria bambusicola]KAI0523718.1 Tho complex subunit 7-domain-containing protein [Xylaria bambusicola]
MATSHFGLLDEREETELHKTRLLAVEERPFKRLTKRLVGPGAFTNPSKLLPSPPPESSHGEAVEAISSTTSPSTADITTLKEDITLDFAAFDSSIARLQFLATANAAEREHYAEARLRILNTMESVREGNGQLRVRLDEARATLAQRRKFDELADKITSNRMLRTRAEQQINLAKLAEECDELRRESEAYGDTWRERRAQFERLVDEGRRLRALIRDEKEEVERREGMDSDAEDGEAAPTPGKGIASGNATPHPENSAAPSGKREAGSGTPRPESNRDERTPRPDSPGAAAVGGEKSRLDVSGSFSRSGSLAPSVTAASQQLEDKGAENGEDIDMNELTTQRQSQDGDTPMGEESQSTVQITVDAPTSVSEDKMDTT